jgi:outer membrane lipoprotein SlyB
MSAKKMMRLVLLPLALTAGLSACTQSSGGMQPGIVNTAAPASGNYRGETGRVVAIRDAAVRGGGGSGVSSGTLVGGGLGAATGAVIGGATTRSAGGAVVGGLIGMVGGAIAGTAIDRSGGGSSQRGIEVTVQRDDGQQVAIAQYDDGDLQMGDRVAIVYDRSGVAKAVRDTGYRRDY